MHHLTTSSKGRTYRLLVHCSQHHPLWGAGLPAWHVVDMRWLTQPTSLDRLDHPARRQVHNNAAAIGCTGVSAEAFL